MSEGINAIAQAMPWTPGDNLVLCTELEHPNNTYPWPHLRKRGVEVRSVPARAGAIDPPADFSEQSLISLKTSICRRGKFRASL